MFGRSREDVRLKEEEWMSQELIKNPIQMEPVLGHSSSNPGVTQTPQGTTRNSWEGNGGSCSAWPYKRLKGRVAGSGQAVLAAAEGADLQ